MTAAHRVIQELLVAEDHPMVAEALAALVAARFPAARVRMAADFPSAVAAAAAQSPQLALIDADMPGAEPLAGVSAILAAAPDTRLIVVSGLRDDALVDALLAAGAAGFLPKTSPAAVMLAAIDQVLAGGQYRPAPLPNGAANALPALAPLSGRLADVARLLAAGLTNKEIARELGVGPETVKSHVAHLLDVLGAANRTEAAVKAQGLLSKARDTSI